jgi:hypothetical protein
LIIIRDGGIDASTRNFCARVLLFWQGRLIPGDSKRPPTEVREHRCPYLITDSLSSIRHSLSLMPGSLSLILSVVRPFGPDHYARDVHVAQTDVIY